MEHSRRAGKRIRREKRIEKVEQTTASVRSIAARVVVAVLALAVCAVPPLFVNDVIGYLPIIVLVLILIISFAYLQILRRSFSFDEDSLAPSCERGSEIDFVLHFRNSSALVFLRLEVDIYISDLFGGADDVTPVQLTLGPHEDREFCFQATFDHIGTYAAGVRRVVIYDLLGLFTHTIVNEKRHNVEVLPHLIEADDIPLSSEISSDSLKPRQALTVDDMDYAGVREYELGDPIKTIHWKLSASNPKGEYLTRLFETYNNPGVAIIMDTTAPDYDSESLMCVFDAIVESALSVNQFAVAAGIDSTLMFRSERGEDFSMRVTDMHDFPELTHALPRIRPADGEDARAMLRREVNSLHGQDNVVLCTAHVDEETISTLVTLKLRKRNPMLFCVVPPSLDSDEVKKYVRPLRRLADSKIPYFALSSASVLGAEVETASRAAQGQGEGR